MVQEMLPSSNDLSELDSVEVTEPQETQKQHKSNTSSSHICLFQNGSNVVAFFKRNAYVLLTVVAVAIGSGLGFALRHMNMSARDIKYLTFPGELLMRVLQMLVLPLIVSSVITAISSLDRKTCGKIGLRALSFYTATTVTAVFTGITLAVLIKPGKSSRTAAASSSGNVASVQPLDSFLDIIRNMIPSNLVEACFRRYITVYSSSVRVINMTETSETSTLPTPNNFSWTPIEDRVPVQGTWEGVNIFGALVFSVAFGLSVGSMGSEGKPLRDFFNCLNKAIMQLVCFVIWYAPVGTLFLMTGQIAKMTDTAEIGRGVALYNLTVIIGLLIHSFFTLPLIYFIITRKNPFTFMNGVLQPLTTAFGTSSSSATLPVTLHCMEENHNMDKQVTRFMLPIGATMNMDGAALYEAVAALFISQVNNMEFNLAQIILLRSQFWMDLFGDLRDSGLFNGSHEHQCLLRFCFSDVLQQDLDECLDLWNKHRIRPSRHASCPGGIPNELYLLPHRFGSRDCGFGVEDRELDVFPEARQVIDLSGDPDMEEYLQQAMGQHGLQQPQDWKTASELYITLKEIAGL